VQHKRGGKRQDNNRFICAASHETAVDFSIVLNHAAKKTPGMPEPTLVVRFTGTGHVPAGAVALANATQDIVLLEGGTACTGMKIVDLVLEQSDLLVSFRSLLSRLNLVLRITAEVARV
jgi:hypothetical protein